MEEPEYMSQVVESTQFMNKKEETASFLERGRMNTEHDLSWHDKHRIADAEDFKHFKDAITGISKTGFRKPHIGMDLRDKREYISDEEILQELKRESVQHFMGRNVSLEKLDSARFADVIGAEEQEKSEAEKAAINDRLVKKSSHRWNKTKRKKLKKSREIMGAAIDKINELQRNDIIAKSDDIQTETIGKKDYEEKFNRYNEIYAAIYKSDCHLAEAVAKDKREEKIIKLKAKRVYFANMFNMATREKKCYEAEASRNMEECYNLSRNADNREEHLKFTKTAARIQERIDFYTAKADYFNEKFIEETTVQSKMNATTISMDAVKSSYDIVSDEEVAEVSKDDNKKILEKWREESKDLSLKDFSDIK